MTPWKHALSSSHKFGGDPEDYADLHNWFDETKGLTGDFRHRALRHHAAGVEEAIRVFGHSIHRRDGKQVATKEVAEQHVIEDCGFIPTVAQWLAPIADHPERWMLKVAKKTKDLEAERDGKPE